MLASVTERVDLGLRVGQDLPWMPNSYEYKAIYKIKLKYDNWASIDIEYTLQMFPYWFKFSVSIGIEGKNLIHVISYMYVHLHEGPIPRIRFQCISGNVNIYLLTCFERYLYQNRKPTRTIYTVLAISKFLILWEHFWRFVWIWQYAAKNRQTNVTDLTTRRLYLINKKYLTDVIYMYYTIFNV